MADNRHRLVKNILHKNCNNCGGRHEFYSRASKHARCGTPVAFKQDDAEALAKAEGMDPMEAVIVVPDDTVVILDDRARKLKRQASESVPMDQVFLTISA